MLFFPYPVRVPYSVLTYIFAIALANELARSVWLIDGMRGSRNAACDAEISLEKLGTASQYFYYYYYKFHFELDCVGLIRFIQHGVLGAGRREFLIRLHGHHATLVFTEEKPKNFSFSQVLNSRPIDRNK